MNIYFQSSFSFHCECKACTENYPPFASFPSHLDDAISQKFESLMRDIWQSLSGQSGHLSDALASCKTAHALLKEGKVPRLHTASQRLVVTTQTVLQRMQGSDF